MGHMNSRSLSYVMAMVLAGSVSAQVRLTGRVVNKAGEGLGFAQAAIGDVPFLAQAEANGEFSLSGLRAGPTRLRIALVGYMSLDTTIVLAEGDNRMSFALRDEDRLLGDVEVTAVRAGDRAPFAKSLMTKEDIARVNTGVDLPYVLGLQPNVVSTSDGGTGIGYTYLRIRGTDGTRTNITLNGVPFNDAESQGAFLVNLPDLATSAEDIEIQRGVGTSTNGPAAFGASMNLRTTSVKREAWGQAAISGGSFNTQRYSISAGTGLLHDRFSLDMRLSSITSDGYVDRASADLKSYFLQGAWVGAKRSVRFITFRGKEVTYQAWGGVPKEVIDTNRTWNGYTYDNQVDNYDQSHYQLLLDQKLGPNATFNLTLFRVNGAGYFEEFRAGDDLSTYGIAPAAINGDTITTTDIIRRRWLDNTLTGANASMEVKHGAHRLVIGGSYSDYRGEHFGEVIWARYAGDLDIGDRYYDDDARKTDANAFAKLTCAVSGSMDVFGDAQVRRVEHRFLGYDNDLENADQRVEYTFFNPKAGVLWRVHEGGKAYASVAVANREPNRDDLVESTPKNRARSERLVDYELGYERRSGRAAYGINGYFMDYKDQLVLTGELSDVGAALRTNVPKSYRAGVELSGAFQLTKRLVCKGNLALSRNKVLAFTEFVDDWDNGGQQAFDLGDRDLSFSPSAVGGGELGYRFWEGATKGNATITWVTKYVSDQYLDNTSSSDRMLDAYTVHDLRLNASLLMLKGVRSLDVNLTLRNLFSEVYESNGWSYAYVGEGHRQSMVGLYPQAPLNVLGGVTFVF
jgi:iron complex outermembrane receptor protein